MAIMPSHESPLTTLSNLYVGSSRHVGRLAIITDDTDRLVKTLEADLAANLEKATYVTDRPEAEPELKSKTEIESKPELEPKMMPNAEHNQPDATAGRSMYTIDPRFITDPDRDIAKQTNAPDPSKESQRVVEPQPKPPEDRQRQRDVIRQRGRSRGGR